MIEKTASKRSRKPHHSFMEEEEEVLFQIEIEHKNDIFLLENKIRELLHCESVSECGFIHSTPYKQMIMSLLLRLNRVISFEEELRLYFGNNGAMVLCMRSNAQTVEIFKKNIDSILDYTIAKVEIEEASSFQKNHHQGGDTAYGIENIETKHVDHKKRKYPRKNQEETFVAHFIHNKKAPALK